MVKKIEVSGIAVREGVSRNKIKYTSEELRKFAPTMIGRKIIKDHKGETDNVIGVVTHCESTDGGKSVKYKGWVKEDGTGITDKIQDGRINEVSIGALAGQLVKESEDSEESIAKNLCGMELSTTPIPGVVGTSLTHNQSESKDEYTEESVKNIIEEFKDCIKEEVTGTGYTADTNTSIAPTTINSTRDALKYIDGKNKAEDFDLKTCAKCGRNFYIPKEERESEIERKLEDDVEGEEEGVTKKGEGRESDKREVPVKDDGDDEASGHEQDYKRSNNNYEYRCPYCGDVYVQDISPAELKKMGEDEMESESIKSNSSSKKEDLIINKREEKMESKEEKITESTKVDESAVKLAESLKEIANLKEQMRQEAITLYTEKAKAKDVTPMNVSNMSLETIKALTSQVDSIKVVEKVEVKEVAKPKSAEVTESKPKVNFDGYVIEHSDLGGYAFRSK